MSQKVDKKPTFPERARVKVYKKLPSAAAKVGKKLTASCRARRTRRRVGRKTEKRAAKRTRQNSRALWRHCFRCQMSFALHIGADGLDDERLLRLREFAEIDVEILQRLVVGIDVVVLVVGFAENVGRERPISQLLMVDCFTPSLSANSHCVVSFSLRRVLRIFANIPYNSYSAVRF